MKPETKRYPARPDRTARDTQTHWGCGRLLGGEMGGADASAVGSPKELATPGQSPDTRPDQSQEPNQANLRVCE